MVRALGWMWMLILAGFATLGLMWWKDQRHDWERPRWDTALFVPILTAAEVDARPPRVVAVQPSCPTCLSGLESVSAHRPLIDSRRLVALIVDCPRPPNSAFAGTLAVDEVWWDARGVWRHHWGRRVYGEIYDFDRLGRLTGSSHVLKSVDDKAPGGR